jgi:DNA-directed RNA polymerase subunit RPC12/RpoP
MSIGDLVGDSIITLPDPKIENFVKKAKLIHDPLRKEKGLPPYDYSLIKEWNGTAKKVLIVCPIHKGFLQTPHVHISKKAGCPKCKTDKARLKIDNIIEKFKSVHGNKYDYSLFTEYKRIDQKIPIICPVHGLFYQQVRNHIKYECKKCADYNHRLKIPDIIKRFKKIHDPIRTSQNLPIYDYSMFTEYMNNAKEIPIICPVKNHGIFMCTTHAHLNGTGCLECYKQVRNTDDFIEKALKVHGTFLKSGLTYFDNDIEMPRYDYSKVEYINTRTKILIKCNKCDYEFEQSPNGHLQHKSGYGCPYCSHHISKKEIELREFIKTLVPEKYLVFNDKKLINPYELDILIVYPYNLALEFNGTYWHSEKFKSADYHEKKTRLCKEQGITLIHVSEFDWDNNNAKIREIIEKYIRGTEAKTDSFVKKELILDTKFDSIPLERREISFTKIRI